MNKPLSKDAKGFVEGVVSYLSNKSSARKAVPKVQAFLGKVTAQARKEKVVRVRSSVELTASEKKAIGDRFSEILGHDVELDTAVDPNVIGGLRIQVGDWVVDTSLKSQLEKMATVLKI